MDEKYSYRCLADWSDTVLKYIGIYQLEFLCKQMSEIVNYGCYSNIRLGEMDQLDKAVHQCHNDDLYVMGNLHRVYNCNMTNTFGWAFQWAQAFSWWHTEFVRIDV